MPGPHPATHRAPAGGPARSAYTPAVSLFKAASTVSLLTLASRVTGLVRDLLMASMFGASALTDAFNVAFRIPNLFRRLFAEGAFSQAFVPVLATHRAQHGEEATRTLISSVATALFWVLLATCVAGVLGAPLPASGAAGTVTGTQGNLVPNSLLAGVSLVTQPQSTATAKSSPTTGQPGNSTTPGAATTPATTPTVPLQGALPTPVTH